MVIGTVPSLQEHQRVFRTIELVSVTIFAIEYLLRLWSADERIKTALRPLMLVDLLVLIPSFMVGFFDLRFARSFRLIRMLKLTRHSKALELVAEVLKRKKDELMSTAFVALLLLTVSSSLIYFAEHPHQPEAFSSIPAAMWWGVATLTTVGYGDVTPITTAGKIIGTFVAFIGIGLFAMPAGILASGFTQVMSERAKK